MKIKVNGQLKTIPERWEEVTFEQFIKLAEPGDQAKIISAILEMPEPEIKGAKIEGLEKILWHLKFLQKPFEIDKQPKKVGDYSFPEKIEFQTIEQYQEVLQEIQRVTSLTPSEQLEAIPFYAAVYVTDPYDSEKARFKAQEFKKLPCTEVMAAGTFFMTKSLSLQSGLPMSYLSRHLPMKKNRLGFRTLVRRLASTKLWIVCQGMWDKMTRRS